MLWGANMKLGKKVGLMVLFSGGIFVIACAILRCVLIVTVGLSRLVILFYGQLLTALSQDPVNGAQLAGSWAVRETFVAVVTTNLPMIFPLFRRWLGPYISTWVSTLRSTQKLEETPHDIVTYGGGGGHGSRGRGGRTPLNSNPITNITFSESEERLAGGADVKMQDLKAWSEAGSGVGHHGHNIKKQVEVAVVTQNREEGGELEDQQRQRAIASLDENAAGGQGHFAFARGPPRTSY